MSKTAAQEEFDNLVARNNNASDEAKVHPEDRHYAHREGGSSDLDEEERHRASEIDAAMRLPTFSSSDGDGAVEIKLPPVSFDSGRATGVKGVIADARSYENARRNKWRDRARAVRRSVFGPDGLGALTLSVNHSSQKSDSGASSMAEEEDGDEEAFLQQWRESRRRELEANGSAVRTRRTSPSVRMFGRLDEVDALGYLDAIEKVGKEVVVVVFVYDDECQVSSMTEQALRPLVRNHPTIHFVKVHYDAIEFENAGVPALLAYRSQGELFANLTGLVEMLPSEDELDTESLQQLMTNHGIL